MSRILFYTPFNNRSRDTESLMIAFQQQGHEVYFLTQQEGDQIIDFLRSKNVKVFSHALPGKRYGWWYYLRHLLFFIRFCWIHRIRIVYSHLEPANFVAAVGQYAVRSKVFICRHHIDEGRLYNFDKDLYYKITYKLAKKVIVVSEHAVRYMTTYEGIPARKIIHINLAYDFGFYHMPSPGEAEAIRNQYQCDTLLLAACRFTKFKRPEVAIQLVRKLVDEGVDAKLILLGRGEMEADLKSLITELNLSDRVFLPGYVSNVLAYMSASDFLVHPSLLESSCVAVKEAGLVSRPAIVCKTIGDFDDYIVNMVNGFSVNKDNFIVDSASIIKSYAPDKKLLHEIGSNLRSSVFRLFSIDSVVGQYESLNSDR